MMFMTEIDVPSGVTVLLDENVVHIKGKCGSAIKKFNAKYVSVKLNGSKVEVGASKNKRFEKMSGYMQTSIANEIASAFKSVEDGIEVKMQIIYSHFPISLEAKGKSIMVKNILGSRIAREAPIVGDTKVEFKGQDVTIKGSDIYAVGQTVANIRKACETKGYDSRVFQDGIYVIKEE